MKVEVDADELCELKRSADKNNMWDYHKVCYDSLKKKYDILDKELTSARNECDALRMMVKESAFHKLRDERDWWRDQAIRRAHLLDDERTIQNKQYSDAAFPKSTSISVIKLGKDARSAGYEVPE